MNTGKTNTRLSIAVIINELSSEQLAMLGKHFERLPNKLHVLLVNKIPCLPVAFYQLREILLLEKKMHQVAREELCKAGNAFNVPAMRQIVQASTLIHVFQALPEIDHLIGHGLDKHHLFLGSQHPVFIGGLRRWVERYASDSTDLIEPTAIKTNSSLPVNEMLCAPQKEFKPIKKNLCSAESYKHFVCS